MVTHPDPRPSGAIDAGATAIIDILEREIRPFVRRLQELERVNQGLIEENAVLKVENEELKGENISLRDEVGKWKAGAEAMDHSENPPAS